MRILVVEDEPRMASLLKQGLEEEGHTVALAENGPLALGMARSTEFDVIVLDVMLPGIDGFGVARRLRNDGDQTPILMLTARDGVSDIIQGLNIGADDYLTKPFSFDVLLARVRAVGRRGPVAQPVTLRCADLQVDTGTREVRRAGRSLVLTRTEYQILELLLRASGRVIPRETIIEAVWGFDRDVEANTLDAFVRLLRSKVDQGFDRKLIQTVRGVGYYLRDQPE